MKRIAAAVMFMAAAVVAHGQASGLSGTVRVMKRTLKAILALAFAATVATAQDTNFAVRISCDFQQQAGAAELPDLTLLQGSAPMIQAAPMRMGRAVSADSLTTCQLVFGPSATSTYYVATNAYLATNRAYYIQLGTIGTNSVPAGSNSPAAWWYSILFHRNGGIYWSGSGRLYIERTTATGTNGLVWQEWEAGAAKDDIARGWIALLSNEVESIESSAVVYGTSSNTAYRGDSGLAASNLAESAYSLAGGVDSNLTAHVADTENPHGVTAAQIGALTAETDEAALAAVAGVESNLQDLAETVGGITAESLGALTAEADAVALSAVAAVSGRVDTVESWGDHGEANYLKDAPGTGGPYARQSNSWLAVTVGSGGLSLEELQALFVSSSNENFMVENDVGGFRIGFHGTNAFRVLAQTTAVARITSFSAGTSNLTFGFESPSESNILWWTEIITPETVASLEWSVYTGEVSFSWSSGIGTATVASVDLTEPRLWRIASDGLAVASNAYARFDVPAYVGDERITTMADLSIASAGSLLYASAIASGKVPLDYSVPVITNEMTPPSEYIPAWSFDLDTGTATVHRLRVGILADTNGNPVSVGDGINSATAGEIATNVLSNATTNDMPGVDWGSLGGGGGIDAAEAGTIATNVITAAIAPLNDGIHSRLTAVMNGSGAAYVWPASSAWWRVYAGNTITGIVPVVDGAGITGADLLLLGLEISREEGVDFSWGGGDAPLAGVTNEVPANEISLHGLWRPSGGTNWVGF